MNVSIIPPAKVGPLGPECRIAAGELEAVFLPQYGMLGSSLRHRGDELLRRVEALESTAQKGGTAGIPFLHPWANRLEGLRYRAGSKEVRLDAANPLLHLDANGLPIHGIGWPKLQWDLAAHSAHEILARLDWNIPERLAVFPFPHQVEMRVRLEPNRLTLETVLTAGPEGAVPISFGFHPYLGLPGMERGAWRLRTPGMKKLITDGRGLPTGAEQAFEAYDSPLGYRTFDDGFALLQPQAAFSLIGGGRSLTVELVEGYPFAQIYAPSTPHCVALEPMTAPTNALASGRALRWVGPGEHFRAVFCIRVEDASATTG